MTTTIRKSLAALALLTLALAPAPQADAYQQVCMKAKFGIGYAFQFRVAWGMQWSNFYAAVNDQRPYHVSGVTGWSSDVHLIKSRCVQLDQIPANEHIAVQLRSGGNRILCNGWDNRRPFLARNAPERRTLWLDAWGALPNPRCKAWKFE